VHFHDPTRADIFHAQKLFFYHNTLLSEFNRFFAKNGFFHLFFHWNPE